MKYIISLAAILATTFAGISHAATYSLTITPVTVCKTDGSDCYTPDADLAAINAIWSQASIEVIFGAGITISDDNFYVLSSYASYTDLLGLMDDAVELQIGTQTPWFAYGPTFDTTTSWTRAYIGSPGFAIWNTAILTDEFEAMIMARGIARTLGLTNCENLYDTSECVNNLVTGDILNLGSNLTAAQIAMAQQSRFLVPIEMTVDPVPVPPAMLAFMTGGAFFAGLRRKRS